MNDIYFYIAISFVAGVVMLLLMQYSLNILKLKFKNLSKTLKSYWKFIIIFGLSSTIGYILIYYLFDRSNFGLIFSVYGQILSLLFAVFVGYYAFKQVVENRREKLKERGYIHIRHRNYARAIDYLEQVVKISYDDHEALANLLELYIIVKNFENFDNKIDDLLESAISKSEKISYHYLKALRRLVEENIGKAKENIGKTVDYIRNNPSSLGAFSWNFNDIKESHVYYQLEGETKYILDNFIKYLDQTMSDDDKIIFEEGDYLLKKNEES
jgi:tetratricopeptide (TPR) repeat protein